MRVLIADDTPSVREAVRYIVESDGHDVVEAGSGTQALALLSSDRFDLAILDIWMPGRSGLDLLKHIRHEQPGLPVIIMSGGGPGASLEQATAIADLYQASHILYKPFDDEELLALLRTLTR